MTEEMIAKLKELARQNTWEDELVYGEEEYLDIDGYAGGQTDDAYYGGYKSGETDTARMILSSMGITWE
jgi:hypothetical protein